jgi:hypothetical protein
MKQSITVAISMKFEGNRKLILKYDMYPNF